MTTAIDFYDETDVTIRGEPYTGYRYTETDLDTGEVVYEGTNYYSESAMHFGTAPEYFTVAGVIDADGRTVVYEEQGALSSLRDDEIVAR